MSSLLTVAPERSVAWESPEVGARPSNRVDADCEQGGDAAVRHAYIDWLRVLATGAVFCFHVARVFNTEDWHVKALSPSVGAGVLVTFLDQWLMPLFFVLSGLSAGYSLTARRNGQFLSERARRLLVPLAFGALVLAIPQVYVERVSHGQFEGTLVAFVPRYFDGLYGFGGNFAWMGLHLWYLLLLALFSLLTLPVLRLLERAPSIGWPAAESVRPWGLLLGAVPIMFVEVVVNTHPDTLGRRDFGGWSILTYLAFYLLGCGLTRASTARAALEARAGTSLLVALLLTAVGGSAVGWLGAPAGSVTISVLRGVRACAWVFAVLGLASRHLDLATGFLRHANRAAMPFYVLHQPVIVAVAYVLLGHVPGGAPGYSAVAVASFAITVGLYEGVVRRSRVLCSLTGTSRERPSASMYGQAAAPHPSASALRLEGARSPSRVR